MQTTFVALYRGESVAGAKLLALSADAKIVGEFAARLLDANPYEHADAVVRELESGRRNALRLVRDLAEG